MLKLGIIGFPLEHSLSPSMQNAALQYLNINGEYKAYEVKEGELKDAITKLINADLKGFNVTIPHKIKIISLLDELTDIAKQACAVNTVIIKNKKTTGDNTDVTGFWEAIPEEIREKFKGKNVAILGCGGSAYACICALLINGINNITVYGRDNNKLERLKKHFESKINISSFDKINLSNTFMLVNTTPIGMYPNTNDSPLIYEQLQKLPQDAIVYDIIYNPEETKLLKDAKSLNKITINGMEMLIRQGAASLAKWVDIKEPPVEIMRLAVGAFCKTPLH